LSSTKDPHTQEVAYFLPKKKKKLLLLYSRYLNLSLLATTYQFIPIQKDDGTGEREKKGANCTADSLLVCDTTTSTGKLEFRWR